MTRLTPDQAQYVLTTLLAQRKLRQTQIDQALRNRESEIRALRERLASLEGMNDGAARSSGRRGRRAGSASARPVRRRKMSPKVRALRRLQGKYMGFVRGLKPAEKARVRSVREKQGMAAAIQLASTLAGRR
ncbi:MAG TPA: hypothetical protein VIZ58_11655 [Thermoanaerobaculia bacterium]